MLFLMNPQFLLYNVIPQFDDNTNLIIPNRYIMFHPSINVTLDLKYKVYFSDWVGTTCHIRCVVPSFGKGHSNLNCPGSIYMLLLEGVKKYQFQNFDSHVVE